MTQELIRKRTVISDEERAPAAGAPWHGLALAAVLILSAFLNLFRLSNEGYGITYYAAAVKDMLTSWHNFFFVSFDAGFVSVDKPPLGLWVQAASAYLFGFHGLSLMLPQALAGILCVALLYHLVRRSFGPVAGLVAALVLAVTPISVATSRNNTMDMLLVLTVLLAAWAVIHAAESGRLRWLLVGAVVVGLGFNIKMLEAFLVLPAFYLLYFMAAPLTWRRRLVHLGVATAMLLIVSLSWAAAVDLTPDDQRPYVGSTSNDTVTNLILGYNGLNRLTGHNGEIGQIGEPGPFRLLQPLNAGQVGWLLPLTVVGLLSVAWRRGPRLPLDRRHQALVLWGTWFLTSAAYFSVAGGGHRYYTVMLAPAVAALVGVGVVALWSDYRGADWSWWLLPFALVNTAVFHARILAAYENWSLRLTPFILGLCLMAAAALVVLRLRPKLNVGTYATLATTIGMLALLIAPTIWASYQVFQGPRGPMPVAGPLSRQASVDRLSGDNTQGGAGGDNMPGDGRVPFGGSNLGDGAPDGASEDVADPALMDYLLANQGDAEYLVAATSSKIAASIILSTDEPVISLGGYNGADPVFTPKKLADLVDEGAVRFFLVPDKQRIMQMMLAQAALLQQSGQQGAPPGAPGGEQGDLPHPPQNRAAKWVQDNCRRVPEELWRSSSLAQGGVNSMKVQSLYDCDAGGR